MSMISLSQNSLRRLARHRAPVVCIAALFALIGRGTPLNLLPGPHGQAAHSFAHQEHGQYFDHHKTQCLSSPPVPQSAPPLATLFYRGLAALPHVEVIIDGGHRDRSPPTV